VEKKEREPLREACPPALAAAGESVARVKGRRKELDGEKFRWGWRVSPFQKKNIVE